MTLGGAEDTLVGSTGSNWIVGWSPDRRRLIFSSDRRGEIGIWSIPVSGQGAQPESLKELVPYARGWQPLGVTRTGALFYRLGADLVDVYTAVLDLPAGRTVSGPQRVTQRYIGAYAFPNWSEDGERLLFNSNRDPAIPRVGIYDVRNAEMRELQLDLARSKRPQWVEHGTAIMVVGRARDGREGLFRIAPRNGQATLFRGKQELESSYEGVWSRDGILHFNRFDDNRRGIFRLNVETGERRILYAPPAGVDVDLENLALSPDGRTLAFHARNKEGGSASLMSMPTEGGESRSLFTVRKPQAFPFGSFTWTPDSRRILAVVTRPGQNKDELQSEIWQVPADGGTPTKIEFPLRPVAAIRLNPDGKTIAFQAPQAKSELWVLQNVL